MTVVAWNPQSMALVGEFSLDGLREDGVDTTTASVHRDGDRLVVLARYFRPDDTAAVLGRLAIIDPGTDTRFQRSVGAEHRGEHRASDYAFGMGVL